MSSDKEVPQVFPWAQDRLGEEQTEEVDIDIEDDLYFIGERLIKEGRYQSWGEIASQGIERKKIENEDQELFKPVFEKDPSVEGRIRELDLICLATEEPFLRHFYADTTHIVQRYARLLNDFSESVDSLDYLSNLRDINEYAADLNYVIRSEDLSETDAELFIDDTTELFNDLVNFAFTIDEEVGEQYEKAIEHYWDTYTEREDGRMNDDKLVQKLVGQ